MIVKGEFQHTLYETIRVHDVYVRLLKKVEVADGTHVFQEVDEYEIKEFIKDAPNLAKPYLPVEFYIVLTPKADSYYDDIYFDWTIETNYEHGNVFYFVTPLDASFNKPKLNQLARAFLGIFNKHTISEYSENFEFDFQLKRDFPVIEEFMRIFENLGFDWEIEKIDFLPSFQQMHNYYITEDAHYQHMDALGIDKDDGFFLHRKLDVNLFNQLQSSNSFVGFKIDKNKKDFSINFVLTPNFILSLHNIAYSDYTANIRKLGNFIRNNTDVSTILNLIKEKSPFPFYQCVFDFRIKIQILNQERQRIFPFNLLLYFSLVVPIELEDTQDNKSNTNQIFINKKSNLALFPSTIWLNNVEQIQNTFANISYIGSYERETEYKFKVLRVINNTPFNVKIFDKMIYPYNSLNLDSSNYILQYYYKSPFKVKTTHAINVEFDSTDLVMNPKYNGTVRFMFLDMQDNTTIELDQTIERLATENRSILAYNLITPQKPHRNTGNYFLLQLYYGKYINSQKIQIKRIEISTPENVKNYLTAIIENYNDIVNKTIENGDTHLVANILITYNDPKKYNSVIENNLKNLIFETTNFKVIYDIIDETTGSALYTNKELNGVLYTHDSSVITEKFEISSKDAYIVYKDSEQRIDFYVNTVGKIIYKVEAEYDKNDFYFIEFLKYQLPINTSMEFFANIKPKKHGILKFKLKFYAESGEIYEKTFICYSVSGLIKEHFKYVQGINVYDGMFQISVIKNGTKIETIKIKNEFDNVKIKNIQVKSLSYFGVSGSIENASDYRNYNQEKNEIIELQLKVFSAIAPGYHLLILRLTIEYMQNIYTVDLPINVFINATNKDVCVIPEVNTLLEFSAYGVKDKKTLKLRNIGNDAGICSFQILTRNQDVFEISDEAMYIGPKSENALNIYYVPKFDGVYYAQLYGRVENQQITFYDLSDYTTEITLRKNLFIQKLKGTTINMNPDIIIPNVVYINDKHALIEIKSISFSPLKISLFATAQNININEKRFILMPYEKKVIFIEIKDDNISDSSNIENQHFDDIKITAKSLIKNNEYNYTVKLIKRAFGAIKFDIYLAKRFTPLIKFGGIFENKIIFENMHENPIEITLQNITDFTNFQIYRFSSVYLWPNQKFELPIMYYPKSLGQHATTVEFLIRDTKTNAEQNYSLEIKGKSILNKKAELQIT